MHHGSNTVTKLVNPRTESFTTRNKRNGRHLQRSKSRDKETSIAYNKTVAEWQIVYLTSKDKFPLCLLTLER